MNQLHAYIVHEIGHSKGIEEGYSRGMADRLPVSAPEQYTRSKNTSHTGEVVSIGADQHFSYGTAGFRQKAELLPFIAYRLGYLAGHRARSLNKSVGLMITASHNPKGDNGLKIVDPMGNMLPTDCEDSASEIVNADDVQLPTAVRALETNITDPAPNARVFIAIDTRESGPYLASAAKTGLSLMNVEYVDLGVMTTPQLHYVVRADNDKPIGSASEIGYYIKHGDAFKELYRITNSTTPFDPEIHIDCANGVGAQKMRLLTRFLDEGSIKPIFHNENGELNHKCGADFVKIDKRLPTDFEGVSASSRCASFDGDADRLIYFRPTGEGDSIEILDGDKIALLFAKYITEQLSLANLSDKLELGIVQTAYANGNSSNYIRNVLKLEPIFVPTGVKHLHKEAEKYDIGIYFEANGHGTVIFSEKFHQTVESASNDNLPLLRLKLISKVINEVVGDALADLLAVELILRHFGWSIETWAEMLYTDAPNIQIKVPVANRSIFKTSYEETTLLQPEGIQEQINALTEKVNQGRAFVRPSGTENIVRVYAEALTSEEAKMLGEEIAEIIRAL